MTHGHIVFFFGRKNKSDFNLVGVYEPNREMALRYAKKYNFDPKLIYNNLDKMLDAVNPEAVVAFGSILEHTTLVEACASRGINVMVEKPLATTVEYAMVYMSFWIYNPRSLVDGNHSSLQYQEKDFNKNEK